jgi:phage shock protein E
MTNRQAVVGTVIVVVLAQAAMAIEHTKDSLDKVKEQIGAKKAILIDVREQSEWDKGHLQDAQLLPLGELKRAAADPSAKDKVIQSIPQNRIVYCHCAKGVRALMAGKILESLGYDVRPLSAGFDQLRDAGFPVAKE